MKSNTYSWSSLPSIIGKKAIVTKEINPTLGVGQIKVEGQDWSAKCDSDEIIEKGTEVEILDVNGVKAVVSSKSTKSSKSEEPTV